MHTWSIANASRGGRLFLGIPPHLGAGKSSAVPAAALTLEAHVGEHWLSQLLKCLLPDDRTWAWWTRQQVIRDCKLAGTRAPASFQPQQLDAVLQRRVWTRQMVLTVLPPSAQAARNSVLAWAGADTEQIPDHIWAAGDGAQSWELARIIEWCSKRRLWRDALIAASLPAARVVTIYDRVYCAIEEQAGAQVEHQLQALASSWGLEIIAGDPADGWITGPSQAL
ncbi:MAG: hypothetical protein RL701_263 [Pseudomonadota bacterium]